MPASRKDAVTLSQTVDRLIAQAAEEADQSLSRDERLNRERRILESAIQELVRQVGCRHLTLHPPACAKGRQDETATALAGGYTLR